MSDGKSGSGGLGCLWIPMSILVIGALASAYLWSGGMDPREAVATGLEWGAWGTGALCCIPIALVLAVLFAAVLARR